MSKRPKKILVVDDSPVSQKITNKFLGAHQYDVISAWDAEECFKKVSEERPDAILLDVILPDGDGKDIALKLNQNPLTAAIPIIFTTNTVNLENDQGYESFEIGGRTYRAFAKPLHNQKLLSVLRKEINRSLFGGELSPKIKKQ